MGGGNPIKVIKGHQVQVFKKMYFWVPMHRKGILGIMAGHTQAEVTKDHQI